MIRSFHSLLLFAVMALALGMVSSATAQEAKPQLSIKAAADFLALQVRGETPAGTTKLEYRFAETGAIADDASWTLVSAVPDAAGAFAFEVTLPRSRWSVLQVRAWQGGQILSRKETTARESPLKLLTPEKIAARPAAEREAWTRYVARSQQRAEREYDVLAAECRKLQLAQSRPAPATSVYFKVESDAAGEWFARAETQVLAEAIMSYQTPTGGWSKAVDYAPGPRPPGTHWTSQKGDAWHYCGTIDNSTTTEQIRLLAGVFAATRREDAKGAAGRGLEYLLEAQFPNGGWPQNYPLESGYHEAITLNDNAMTHAVEVLTTVGEGKPPFAFADPALRQRAAAAVEKAIACLAAAQVRVEGQLTVWCAQHDPLTLAPVRARLKEPPSLSSSESGEWLKFLMRRGPLRADITAMIEPALAWLDAHRLTGLRKITTPEGRTDYVADAASSEIYWARFYDVESGRPIFPGSQDGIIYPTYHEMAAKNKVAYDFITTRPRDLLEKEAPRWRKRLARGK